MRRQSEKMPAKKRTSKAKNSASNVRERILKAVANSRERNGIPLSTLKKALAAGGYDVVKNKARVKIAIRNLLNRGTLVQTRGFGASAAFKINPGAVGVRVRRPRGKKAGRRGRKRGARRAGRKGRGRKRGGAKKSRKRRRSRAAKRAGKGKKRSAKGRRRRGRKAAGKRAGKRRARKAGSRRRRR